jgi:hypothetical protein
MNIHQIRQNIIGWMSSLFWDVMQRLLVVTDVSEQTVDPIFKGETFQERMLDF